MDEEPDERFDKELDDNEFFKKNLSEESSHDFFSSLYLKMLWEEYDIAHLLMTEDAKAIMKFTNVSENREKLYKTKNLNWPALINYFTDKGLADGDLTIDCKLSKTKKQKFLVYKEEGDGLVVIRAGGVEDV